MDFTVKTPVDYVEVYVHRKSRVTLAREIHHTKQSRVWGSESFKTSELWKNKTERILRNTNSSTGTNQTGSMWNKFRTSETNSNRNNFQSPENKNRL